MALPFPRSVYAPYNVQKLSDELREVIEQHRRDDASLTEAGIADAIKMVKPRLTPAAAALSNAHKVVIIVATIFGIAIAGSSMMAMNTIYDTLHEQGMIKNPFSDR